MPRDRPTRSRAGGQGLAARRHAVRASAGSARPTGSTRSGWMASASSRRPSTSRGPGRVTIRSLTGRIAPVLTAVITFQPGRAATCSARHPVRGVAEQDQLRVGRDELLERDREVGRAAGRDRVAAGELDHLGDERVVGGRVDRARWRRARRRSAARAAPAVARRRPRRSRPASCAVISAAARPARRRSPMSSMSVEDGREVRARRRRPPGCRARGAARSPRAG